MNIKPVWCHDGSVAVEITLDYRKSGEVREITFGDSNSSFKLGAQGITVYLDEEDNPIRVDIFGPGQ